MMYTGEQEFKTQIWFKSHKHQAGCCRVCWHLEAWFHLSFALLSSIWFDDVDPDDIEATLGPEAAKVARRNLGMKDNQPKQSTEQTLVKEKAFEG